MIGNNNENLLSTDLFEKVRLDAGSQQISPLVEHEFDELSEPADARNDHMREMRKRI